MVATSKPSKKYDHLVVWQMNNTETLVPSKCGIRPFSKETSHPGKWSIQPYEEEFFSS